jgi:putative SOS response-associated peptidase YedK
VRSFAIVMTEPNALCAELYNRMPVVLGPKTWPAWLGRRLPTRAQLKGLLVPYPADEMACRPVRPRVGNVKNNDPSRIEAVAVR